MSTEYIAETDLAEKGVTGLPDTPDISSEQLKYKFEEIVREVVIPKVNEMIDQINGLDERTENLNIQNFTAAVLTSVISALIGSNTFVREEVDPTVPEWAKSQSKPIYTAQEVGADAAGAAENAVYAHTQGGNSHPDIRLLLSALSTEKASAAALSSHTGNSNIHVTAADKTAWNGKQDAIEENTYDDYGAASGAVSTHNTSQTSHSDIRQLITTLTSRLDALSDSSGDTLEQITELVQFIEDNRDVIESVTTGKVNVSDIVDNLTSNISNKPLSAAQGVALKGLIDTLTTALTTHAADGSVHVTAAEKTAWNNKQSAIPANTYDQYGAAASAVNTHNNSSSAHSDQFAQKYAKPAQGIPKTDLASAVQTSLNNGDSAKQSVDTHMANSGIHVTAAEKAAWNNKSEFSGDFNDLVNKPAALTVDSALSSTSESPVQNKVIYNALEQVKGLTAKKWNATTTYAAGNITEHDGGLWKSNTANSNSEPASGNPDWTAVTVGEELGALKVKMVKVWENASPASVFNSQSISLDLTQYQIYFILVRLSTSDARVIGQFSDVGSGSYMFNSSGYNNVSASRGVTYSANLLTFTDCHHNLQINNSSVIPYKIYGIKGVD